MDYKKIIFLFCLILFSQAHIYSSTPKVTYAFDGSPLIYHLFLSLETGIDGSDYFKITWPQVIHTGAKTTIVVKLISFSNNLQIVSATFIASPAGATPIYFVTFGYPLTAGKWYEIQIYPNLNPTNNQGLIQIEALSDYGSNAISYDSNLAFGFINIDSGLASNGSLVVSSSSVSTQKNRTASIYTILIDITPTITSAIGGNFTVQIYYDNAVPSHNSGTTLLDFSFMGLCQSVQGPNGTASLNFCSISADLSTITFSLNSITASSTIRISTQISNPLYVSTRGIKAYWVDFISGQVKQNGKAPTALTVLPISITAPATGRVYLLWGIDKVYADASLTTLNLGIFKSTGSTVGPFNSFNIGFYVSDTSPINGQYKVIMKLGATGLLQGALAHNLPSYGGNQVYCIYNVASTQIECTNVGAFINTASTSYRYFISGKAHYSTTVSVSSFTNFGDVQIIPIVYDNNNNLLSVSLFTQLTSGQTISVIDSQQYLDTSGFHSPSKYKIGNAQVVSYADNGALTSTGDAVQSFLTGTNSTIGIVPDLGVSQQLLFLMKVNTITSGGSSSKFYYMKLLYNSQVIGFQSGYSNRGLDFVGYKNFTGTWDISYSPCYQTGKQVCEKFNVATPNKNTQIQVTQSSIYNNYGLYTFACGEAYAASPPCVSSDCSTQCNMFTGDGNIDLKSSVMAMRKVTFPTGYHSSIYADGNLLDFVIVLFQGSTRVSSALINAYTVVGKTMQNIKASYVNYYDNTNSDYNKGMRLPMMIRIAGGVLPTQSVNATVVGVYFDDNIDANTFWTQYGFSYSIGCSTSNCNYYPNTGVVLPKNDVWHTNRAIHFYSIPPIQSEFNLLVPVTPSSQRSPPKIMTLAFFSQNYSIAQATGLLKTLAVFRLFGPVVTSAINGSIPTINSLARTSQGPPMNFDSDWTQSGYSFTYAINTTNINLNPPNNTFTFGTNYPSNYGTAYGCGVTLTSFYYNIFASSTLAFESPPSNTATTCTVFGYLYNELQNPSINTQRNKKWVYTAFCPLDSTIDLNSAAGNIKFLNPQYPNVFTTGFPLSATLAYGLSDQNGYLRAYKRQTQSITSFSRTCTTSKLQPYNPANATAGFGKQRATFSVTTPQILMASNGVDGYPKFKVSINLPGSIGSSLSMQSPDCQIISDPLLTCIALSGGTSSIVVQVTYAGTSTYTVNSLNLGLYAKTTGSLGTAAAYTLSINLPQQSVSNSVIFGTTYSPTTSYCSCTSSFTVGITPNGAAMIFNSLTTLTNTPAIKTPISFNFGSSSYRQTFFSTSVYRFNYGFLSVPLATDYTNQNCRCLIYQNIAGALSLSNKWKSLDLSALTTVNLVPKVQISQPNSLLYTMTCYGSGAPTGANVNPMTLSWIDSTDTIQTATSISTVAYLGTVPGTVTLAINNKRFKTEGQKAFYSFTVTAATNLDQNSRLYFDFHFKLSSKLDRQGRVQCYTRTAAAIVDANSVFSYCQFTYQRQLVIWNNVNLNASTPLYIDIFNIQQPKVADIVTATQKITLTVDTDTNYTNGIYATTSIGDIVPLANSAANIKILSVTLNTTYIRSPQTIVINFNTITNIFSAGKNIYLVIPPSYSQWITRGYVKTAACLLTVTGSNTNLVTACSFISQRILKVVVTTSSNTLYTLTVSNMISPSTLPTGKNNQFRFKLFCSDASQSAVTHYSFSDYSKQLSLNPDQNLIDLNWLQFTLLQGDSLINLSQSNDGSNIIYIGYFSNALELRQSLYPNNFQTSIQLIINNFPTNQFISLNPLNVYLGKSQALFRLAANASVAAGLYTIQFTKSLDTKNLYTAIPPLTVVVSNSLCSLKVKQVSYTLPIGGSTLPIVIDAINCIPIQQIQIGLTFSQAGVSVNADLSSLTLTKASLDGKIYIVLRHTSSSLIAGQVVTVNFAITGANSASYTAIPSVTLTIVDATSYQILPSATALTSPVLLTNTAKFTLQCSTGSTIYWGLGIYPSILNSQALDFQARIISKGAGLITNYTQENDFYSRVYGISYVTTTQTLQKVLYNLKSNSQYIFKYFCVNQLGYSSDSQSISFSALNYGAYLMKVSATFRGAITYGQYNDLACSLSQNFKIPYSRVMTQAMSYCGVNSTLFYPTSNSTISNVADTNGQYLYGFYILPDYSLSTDLTNINIRTSLALQSFTTTIVTSTVNFASLPQFVQMQTQDIQVFTTPIISISDPISGLNSVQITGSITNMNGFIVIGIMPGLFNSTNFTLPTSQNIKLGIFEDTTKLLAVKMQYAPQNFNVSFSIESLTADTEYTAFYFGTSDDPTITALSTTVSYKSFATLQVLDININYLPLQTISLLGMLLIMIWMI